MTGRFGIKSVPSLLFFNGGSLQQLVVGNAPKDQIETQIAGILSQAEMVRNQQTRSKQDRWVGPDESS